MLSADTKYFFPRKSRGRGEGQFQRQLSLGTAEWAFDELRLKDALQLARRVARKCEVTRWVPDQEFEVIDLCGAIRLEGRIGLANGNLSAAEAAFRRSEEVCAAFLREDRRCDAWAARQKRPAQARVQLKFARLAPDHKAVAAAGVEIKRAHLALAQTSHARHSLSSPARVFLNHATALGMGEAHASDSVLACSMSVLSTQGDQASAKTADDAMFLVEKYWTRERLLRQERIRYGQFLLAEAVLLVNWDRPHLADERLHEALEILAADDAGGPRARLAKIFPYAVVQAALGDTAHAIDVLQSAKRFAIACGMRAYAAGFNRLAGDLQREPRLRLPVRALTV